MMMEISVDDEMMMAFNCYLLVLAMADGYCLLYLFLTTWAAPFYTSASSLRHRV